MLLSIGIIIIPLVLYLLAVIALDSHTLFRWRTLTKSLLGGIGAAVVAMVLLRGLRPLMGDEASDWIDPVIEEVLNILALVPLLKRRRIAMFSDAVIYGAAVGSGFALIENLVYLQVEQLNPSLLLFRSISTSLLHMGNVAISALLFGLLFKQRSKRGRLVWSSLMPFVIPVVIHLLYNNIHLLSPNFKFIVLLVLFTAVLLVVSVRNDRWMQQWLDEGVSTHTALLSKIRQGQFFSTPQGQWLLEQQSNYTPEQFFDVYSYLRVTLELSIIAKSRQIMIEAGMRPQDNSDVSVTQLVKEYEELSKRLGPAVVRSLRPIVYLHHSDKWVLEQGKR